MTANVGLGAAYSFSTIQSLIASMNSSWNAYTSDPDKTAAGDCLLVTQNGFNGIQQALAAASQVVPMFTSFGGYPASYAGQAASAIQKAQTDSVTNSTAWSDPCVANQYAADVSNAVSFAQSAYNSLLQAVQQAQQGNATSLSIPTLGFGALTVAVLGWQYSTRPIAAQVQGMLANSWPQASGQFQSATLNVASVLDTGRNDLLGNPIYIAQVSVSGGGSVTAYPASKAGNNGTGYNAVLCAPTGWCLGVVSFQQGHLLPISPVPASTPFQTFPVHTGAPFPVFTTTPPAGGTTTPPAGGTTPPVGITHPGATTPHAGATAPPAGTSSTGKDVLIGVAVTAGLAAVGAGIMWFAHRQHQRETSTKKKR